MGQGTALRLVDGNIPKLQMSHFVLIAMQDDGVFLPEVMEKGKYDIVTAHIPSR